MEVIRILVYLTILGLAILLLQQNLLFLSQALFTVFASNNNVTVSFKNVFNRLYVNERFLSVTFSCSIFRHKHYPITIRSKKMKTLAKELSPSYLRVGGTLCDFLIFNMTEDTTLRFKPHKPKYVEINGEMIDANKNFTMTPYDWDLLNVFAMESGWDLIFDFNVFLRKNGQWDPTNAIELLKYTIQQGYKPAGYELGNEPNLFTHDFPTHVITPEQLATDYKLFVSTIKASGLTDYVINGPETSHGSDRGYFPGYYTEPNAYFHNFNFTIPAPEMADYFSILKQTLDSIPALGKPVIIGPDTSDIGKHRPQPNAYFHNFNFSIPAPEMADYFSILKQTLDSIPALGKPVLIGPDTTAFRHKSAQPDLYPTSFNISIPGDLMAQYISVFKQTLDQFPELGTPFIVSPDTTKSLAAHEYLVKFLESGGGDIVDIASFHHYYLNSATATVAEFHEAKVLDSLIIQLTDALTACRDYAPGKQCWLGETSSSYGGGAGGISDRYVASFLWLDKLGLSAKMGLQGVMRQSFYGGNYGLIDADLNPNPDYWLTVLYKRLVGNIVLDIGKSTNTNLRYYAHCANTNSTMGYKVGDVVVYLMNIGDEIITVDIAGVSSSTYHIYMLSPGDSNGLTSHFVKLNGELLKMQSDVLLPLFDPIVQEGGQITVNPYNMGYIVLPNAKLLQCI